MPDLVDVRVDECNIVVAGYAVAQRVEPLIYPLHHHLVRKTVPHVHELCAAQSHAQD